MTLLASRYFIIVLLILLLCLACLGAARGAEIETAPVSSDFNSCKKQSQTIQQEKRLYKWKNNKGVLHFSDKLPKSKDYYDLAIRNYKASDFFSLNIDSQYAKLPVFALDSIKRDMNKIYHILTRKIGVSQLNFITLKLKIFDDKQTFLDYKNQLLPGHY